MKYIYDDGGRKDAGFKGDARDCVCRAIAIATERPYQEIYNLINAFAEDERKTSKKGRSSARTGVYKDTIRKVMAHLGWVWHPTMKIGQGCKVHLRDGELPNGRLIVALSKHETAVIDGVIHDTFDPSRDGDRCVYGYYTKAEDGKKRKLTETQVAVCEKLDWRISYGEYCDGTTAVELEKYSPAGEDFIMTVSADDFEGDIIRYWQGFDPDDHAKTVHGMRGAPDSLRTLLEDADAIEAMVKELHDALIAVHEGRKTVDQLGEDETQKDEFAVILNEMRTLVKCPMDGAGCGNLDGVHREWADRLEDALKRKGWSR